MNPQEHGALVTLSWRFDHPFVESAATKARRSKKPGRKIPWSAKCEECGLEHDHPSHAGFPPSLNDFLESTGANFRYRYVKKVWGEVFLDLVEESGLPLSTRITAEGLVIFPDRIQRDQGNFRFFTEKCLGDAIERSGRLVTEDGRQQNDSWDFYSFGGLDYRYEKGVRGLEIVLMPTVALGAYAASTNGSGT